MDASSPFSVFWRSLDKPARIKFAEDAKTTVNQCNGLAYSPERKAGPGLAARLAAASNGQLTAEQVCPHFPWHLAGQQAAAA